MINHKGINGEAEVSQWITEGIKEQAIIYAEAFGKYLADRNRLSTSQIRNVYGEVKRIEMKGIDNEDFETEIWLLKPKLAYTRARATGTEGREALASFEKVLGAGIDAIFRGTKESEFKRFKNFASFFEAILAYHRAEGGK